MQRDDFCATWSRRLVLSDDAQVGEMGAWREGAADEWLTANELCCTTADSGWTYGITCAMWRSGSPRTSTGRSSLSPPCRPALRGGPQFGQSRGPRCCVGCDSKQV